MPKPTSIILASSVFSLTYVLMTNPGAWMPYACMAFISLAFFVQGSVVDKQKQAIAKLEFLLAIAAMKSIAERLGVAHEKKEPTGPWG